MRYIVCCITIFCLIAACKLENKQQTPTVTVPTSQEPKTALNGSREIRNWTCIPGEKVGLIEANFTEADIIKAYGQDKVVREEIGVGEGESTTATVLFPKTDEEIFISWKSGKAFQEIAEVLIENEESPWTTSQGIGIGTTLEELITINGKDFQFAGFEWDYSGFTREWQDGKINPKLGVFLEPSNPEAVYPDLLGDDLFSSNLPKAKAADLRVRSMIIYF